MIDFRFNYPLTSSHHELMKGVLAGISEEISLRMVPVGGVGEDREIGARWLSRPDHIIDAENILIAGGGHNALTSILLGLKFSGEVVVTDSITYNGFSALARMLNVRLIPCAFDSEGMLPDALENICIQVGAKAVYLMPTVHNPLCITMPENRRREIVEVARKYDLMLIDDDAYGFLEVQSPPNFEQLAPERSFYIYSFAKPLAAGLKCSYIISPPKWQSNIVEGIRLSGSGAPALTTTLVGRLINTGVANRIIQEKRVEGAFRQKIVSEILTGLPYISQENSFHLWVPLSLKTDVALFEGELKNVGVEVVTSLAYQVENNPKNNGFRIALGNVENHSEIRTGLKIISDILRKP
ncbi:PLP-dependent aminotransferase family protein [Dyadobacter sp. Leaf189]|uniref:aminotransferase-like domain-containing protein n=1 Tax=Dyadobacter sp. Leaf189 TaxID=1736295 RepID=UPI00070022C9|nr:PLP-dependent aminotransferase family protein [Dyadobacter sp. Leaf189]KQS33178.1 hypothetical protein ASG33_03585 [Dyadobacter sp. Leaf189]